MIDRKIVLDTETTGLSPSSGHRIVEIGCVELINNIPTGKTFHCYINPEFPVNEYAFEVHGLSNEFLSDKPKFKEIHNEFIEFIGDSKLVIHNAPFDMKFINAELKIIEKSPIAMDMAIDTLKIARSMFRGIRNNLDALCERFEISIENRVERHGALIDSELLAKVYLKLITKEQQVATSV